MAKHIALTTSASQREAAEQAALRARMRRIEQEAMTDLFLRIQALSRKADVRAGRVPV